MKELYKKSARTLSWAEVTTSDMKKFLGLVVLMGQIKKSHWRDYWSTDPLVEAPIFSKTMSRIRFEQVLTFFHLSDNTQSTIVETGFLRLDLYWNILLQNSNLCICLNSSYHLMSNDN